MVRHTGEDLIDVACIAVPAMLSFQSSDVKSTESDAEPAQRAQRVLWAPEADRFPGDDDASLRE